MIATPQPRSLFGFAGFCALMGYNVLFEGRFVSHLKMKFDNQQEHQRQQLQQQQQRRTILQDLHPEGGPRNFTTATIAIDASHPVFVLGLPNHLELALPRYFECGNITQENNKLARHWTTQPVRGKHRRHPSIDRWEIGRYMKENVKKMSDPKRKQRKTIMAHVSKKFEVFMDLQFLQAPKYRDGKPITKEDCFDPVLYPGALEALLQSYPKGATILNVIRDPMEWFQSLSPNYPKMWNEWCNPTHDDAFPSAEEIGNQRAMIGFYTEYQHKLRSFAKANPHWKYIEIDMGNNNNNDNTATAVRLEQQLGIEAQCWKDSTRGNIQHLTPTDPNIPSVVQNQIRPNNVGWPMLVTALPKAGTSTIHDYFRCGLGDWTSAHQWTTRTVEPYQTMAVGECMIDNTDYNDNLLLLNTTTTTSTSTSRAFLEGCGNQLVWSDTGVLRQNGKREERKCYFPFLHRNGLERFYESYPYGTLLNVVRNTSSWVDSAFRWKQLPIRWINAQCEEMPTSRAVQEWENWYDNVQDIIRQFAMEHPTLTYIEIPLNHQTSDILYDIFRFPKQCWGHSNINKFNPVTTNTTKQDVMSNASTTHSSSSVAAATTGIRSVAETISNITSFVNTTTTS